MWIAGTHAMELPVNRPHQGDGYPTLDKKKLAGVGLLTLLCEAARQAFQHGVLFIP